MYEGVFSPPKIRQWLEDWERMNRTLWMLALKMNYIFNFWKPNMPHVGGLRPPILLLAATRMSSWSDASRPCLAPALYLNSRVSERRMTSGAQTFGYWSKGITKNPTPELQNFPSEEEAVFTAQGQRLLCPYQSCSRAKQSGNSLS